MLAYARWQNGDRQGALAAAREYVRLAPDHPNAHDSYAEILQWSVQLPEAMQEYQRAHEIDPTFGAGMLGMAEVHWLSGRTGAAREAYTKAAELARMPAEAQELKLAASVTSYNRAMALGEALFGDRARRDTWPRPRSPVARPCRR